MKTTPGQTLGPGPGIGIFNGGTRMSSAPPPPPSLEITEQALTRGELDPLVIASNGPSHTAAQFTAVRQFQKERCRFPFLPLKPESFLGRLFTELF